MLYVLLQRISSCLVLQNNHKNRNFEGSYNFYLEAGSMQDHTIFEAGSLQDQSTFEACWMQDHATGNSKIISVKSQGKISS